MHICYVFWQSDLVFFFLFDREKISESHGGKWEGLLLKYNTGKSSKESGESLEWNRELKVKSTDRYIGTIKIQI